MINVKYTKTPRQEEKKTTDGSLNLSSAHKSTQKQQRTNR